MVFIWFKIFICCFLINESIVFCTSEWESCKKIIENLDGKISITGELPDLDSLIVFLEPIITGYAKGIFNRLRKPAPFELEDLISEGMLELSRSYKNYDPRRSESFLRTYLLGNCYLKMKTYARRQTGRKWDQYLSNSEQIEWMSNGSLCPRNQLIITEECANVEKDIIEALELIPETDRLIFYLYYFKDKSIIDISVIIGVSKSTVYARLIGRSGYYDKKIKAWVKPLDVIREALKKYYK